jgi:hypothetical protein
VMSPLFIGVIPVIIALSDASAGRKILFVLTATWCGAGLSLVVADGNSSDNAESP